MIEWLISSSVLIVVIIALRYLLKGKVSLRLQYALWGLVLLRLLLPFSVGSSGFSVMNALPDRVSQTVLSGGTSDSAVLASPIPAVPDTPSAVHGESEPNIAYNNDSVTDGSVKVTDWGGIIKAVWLTGMAVVGLWLLISNLRFAGKLKKSRQALLCEYCKLPVYLSNAVDTPCLFGLFRPSIYVTPEATESETRLRHIVAHEMTHRRHGDNFWAILRGVCLALHWYNPLVWWAAVLSRNDAELACDEATIQRIGEQERAEYGRTLLAMTCQKRPALLTAATTMTGGKSSIKERITLLTRKPKMAVYTLVAVVLIAAVAAGCTFTGAKADDSSADEDVALYDCGGLTAAIPNEYVDQLIVYTGDELENDRVLISVYQSVSVQAAAADGIDDSSSGWLFSLLRYDRTQYERYLCSDRSGLSFFARDDAWYYGYCIATDVQFYSGFGEVSFEEALAQWEILNNQMGPSVRDDFIERNGLTPYSDSEAFSSYTYDGEHQFLNYYPSYAKDGSKNEVYTLVLSQPAKQGDGGIWCVERIMDQHDHVYLWFPDSGMPAAEYYAQLQAECDAGHKADLLDIEAAALTFLNESGYLGNEVIEGSLEPVAEPKEAESTDIYKEAERAIESYMSDIMGDDPALASYSIDGMEQVDNDILAVVQYNRSMGEGSLYLFILGQEAGKRTVTDRVDGNLPMSMGVELYKSTFSNKTVVFGAVNDKLWFDLEGMPKPVDFTEVKALCSNGTEQSATVSNYQAFLMCIDGDVSIDEVLFLSGSEIVGRLSELPFSEPIKNLNTQGSLY